MRPWAGGHPNRWTLQVLVLKLGQFLEILSTSSLILEQRGGISSVHINNSTNSFARAFSIANFLNLKEALNSFFSLQISTNCQNKLKPFEKYQIMPQWRNRDKIRGNDNNSHQTQHTFACGSGVRHIISHKLYTIQTDDMLNPTTWIAFTWPASETHNSRIRVVVRLIYGPNIHICPY